MTTTRMGNFPRTATGGSREITLCRSKLHGRQRLLTGPGRDAEQLHADDPIIFIEVQDHAGAHLFGFDDPAFALVPKLQLGCAVLESLTSFLLSEVNYRHTGKTTMHIAIGNIPNPVGVGPLRVPFPG
uniref:Uncharacterized protein n=1 Tax=Candidatus Kentrum eta TaxID=2126337 RepID=A0A450V358_9GAMM|nr:MAG: hypothetical protein BECKH772A_GA0070896_100308 [Candidatus Kentron sp. H]VFJ99185.1 MAG: hypothetical protein BECKH772C_GA0070978_1002924 [Candidatus Kentron sp. H]VFK00564.1 MAG: hypothetical protein BECKH772B_GA0070898_101952 [Candidatus Kentron sp. H]